MNGIASTLEVSETQGKVLGKKRGTEKMSERANGRIPHIAAADDSGDSNAAPIDWSVDHALHHCHRT